MLVNLLVSFILIIMSFYIRSVVENSITTEIITWSMFVIGVVLLVTSLYYLNVGTSSQG